MSSAFLPWHREFLHLFENALREVSGNPNITIPYWDWTDPNSTAAVFSPDFMGGMGKKTMRYAVMNGIQTTIKDTLDISTLGYTYAAP